jgi:hypothetical protein
MPRRTVTVTSLRALPKAHADPANAAGAQRFFAGGAVVLRYACELLPPARRARVLKTR